MDRLDRDELDALIMEIQLLISIVIGGACSVLLSGRFGIVPLGSVLMGTVVCFICFYYSFDIIAIIGDAMSEDDSSIKT